MGSIHYQVHQVEAVQQRAARYTLSSYRCTSGVTAMLSELNWQPLAERRRHARLVMFYKIYFQLVPICMPLTLKHHLQPTRTETMFAYMIGKLKCTLHIESIYKKLIKYCSIFYKLRDKLPIRMLKDIYYAFVHPHILYGIEIYANTKISYLDKLIQEAQLMLTTGSTRLAVSRGQQTWYHSTCYI